jgi:hypothetical protein
VQRLTPDACVRLLDAVRPQLDEESAGRRTELLALRARMTKRAKLVQQLRDLELSMLCADVRDRAKQYALTYPGAEPPADAADPGDVNPDLMMADCDLAEARLQQFGAAYQAGEGKGPGLADAAAARQQAAGERTAPAAPTPADYAAGPRRAAADDRPVHQPARRRRAVGAGPGLRAAVIGRGRSGHGGR